MAASPPRASGWPSSRKVCAPRSRRKVRVMAAFSNRRLARHRLLSLRTSDGGFRVSASGAGCQHQGKIVVGTLGKAWRLQEAPQLLLRRGPIGRVFDETQQGVEE